MRAVSDGYFGLSLESIQHGALGSARPCLLWPTTGTAKEKADVVLSPADNGDMLEDFMVSSTRRREARERHG